MKRAAYAAVTAGASILAGMIARRLVTALWNTFSDVEAPVNPDDRDARWSQAIGWGVAAGVAAGVARVVARRLATAGWERAFDEPAPGAASD